VYLSPAWFALAALLTLAYGRQAAGDGPTVLRYGLGAGFVLFLLGSVFLHELGHALVCRRYGIGVRAITLEVLGGHTEMDRDAPRPGVELAVSLAGPLTSFVLGGLLAGAARLLPPHTVGGRLLVQLAISNLVVAVFNALPGLPLDGGRALQALIWALTGDPHRGNRIAGWTGRLLAVGCAGAALAAYLSRQLSLPGAALVVLVGLTLEYGAGQAIWHGRRAARLSRLSAGALARPIFPVPTGMPLGEARRRAADAALGVADDDGRLVALVHSSTAATAPEDSAVDTLAEDVTAERTISAGLRGADVLRAVQADPLGEYLVMSGQDVVGVLRAADVARVLRRRQGRGERAAPRETSA
jgi:Zn-dependent protease